jgi:hypothetical protein
MRTCSGIKADGSRCRAFAMKGSDYCLNHDPNRVEEHRRRSSRGGKRGGRGRPRVELSYIRAQLQDLKDSVLDGSVERGDASVAGNLLNYMTRCIQIELAAREQEELVDRLEKLEQALEEHRKMSGRGVA